MKPDIRYRSGRFIGRNGRLFWPLGGFYINFMQTERPAGVAALAGNTPMQRATRDERNAYFRTLASAGVNALRMFCRVHDTVAGHPADLPLDIAGHVNPDVWAVMDEVMQDGYRHDLRFLVTLFAEPRASAYLHWAPWSAGIEAYRRNRWPFNRFMPNDPGDRQLLKGYREYFTDPEAVALQTQYLRELAPLLRNHPAVFAVEIYNEQAWEGFFQWDSQDAEIAWTRRMVDLWRTLCPEKPICYSLAGHGIIGIDPIRWTRGIQPDFFSSHLYPGACADSELLDYGGMAALVHDYCAAVGPNWPGEAGALMAVDAAHEGRRRRALRDLIWLTVVSGGAGFMQWPLERQPLEHLQEYRNAQSLLQPARWVLKADDRHGFTVNIGSAADALGRAVSFEEKLRSEEFRRLCRLERRALERGVTLRLTLTGRAPDLMTIDIDALDFSGPLRPSPGWEARTLMSSDRRHALCYVRSVMPVRDQNGWMRDPSNKPLWLLPALPAGLWDVTAMSLDTGDRYSFRLRSPGVAVTAPLSGDLVLAADRLNE